MITLTGKNILVTGGSLGIGKAAAQACLAAGANVVIAARNADALDSTRKEFESSFQQRIRSVQADVSVAHEVENAIRIVESTFGSLSGIIHAAAIYGPIGPVDTVDMEEWLDAVRINLYGTFLVAREGCRTLKKRGGGRLVFFSGGGAAAPFPNYTAYACSKAAVVRLTETLAVEMAEFNIEVNCVAPGMVATRLHAATLSAGSLAGEEFLAKTRLALQKGAVPASVGGTCAAFLVSNAAHGITGKFVAAPYDNYAHWLEHRDVLEQTDVFTLRRIVPRDRGMDWQ